MYRGQYAYPSSIDAEFHTGTLFPVSMLETNRMIIRNAKRRERQRTTL